MFIISTANRKKWSYLVVTTSLLFVPRRRLGPGSVPVSVVANASDQETDKPRRQTGSRQTVSDPVTFARHCAAETASKPLHVIANR